MDGHRAPLGSRTQATLSWPWLAENGGLVSGGGTAAERAGSGAWGSPISNLGGVLAGAHKGFALAGLH